MDGRGYNASATTRRPPAGAASSPGTSKPLPDMILRTIISEFRRAFAMSDEAAAAAHGAKARMVGRAFGNANTQSASGVVPPNAPSREGESLRHDTRSMPVGPLAVAVLSLLAFGTCIACVGGGAILTTWPLALASIPLFIAECQKSMGARKSARRMGSRWAFAIGVTAVELAFHFAWATDYRGFATGSSTSAVALFFLPFWAVGAGIVAVLLRLLIGAIVAECSRPAG